MTSGDHVVTDNFRRLSIVGTFVTRMVERQAREQQEQAQAQAQAPALRQARAQNQ